MSKKIKDKFSFKHKSFYPALTHTAEKLVGGDFKVVWNYPDGRQRNVIYLRAVVRHALRDGLWIEVEPQEEAQKPVAVIEQGKEAPLDILIYRFAKVFPDGKVTITQRDNTVVSSNKAFNSQDFVVDYFGIKYVAKTEPALRELVERLLDLQDYREDAA